MNRSASLIPLFLLFLGLVASTAGTESSVAPPPLPLTLTFLGNEGFLIKSGEHKILIDALAAQDPQYILLPQKLHRELRQAKPPFDEVDLVLATHRHHDHFEAEGVSQYLLAEPKARFISTPQVIDELKQHSPSWEALKARTLGAYPPVGERKTIRDLPFKLDLLRLHHGLDRRPLTENLAFLIEINGWKLLHLGDTEGSFEDFEPYALHAENIDIALVPSWFFVRAPWLGVIEKTVQPKHWVMMHLAPNWHREARTLGQRQSRARVANVRKNRPEILIFEEALDQHRFEKTNVPNKNVPHKNIQH